MSARVPGSCPDATDGAIRATRREAWVTGFDCGAGTVLHGRHPTGRWPRPCVIDRAGVLALFLASGSHERDGKGSKTLTRTENTRAARLRGDLARDRRSRRVSSAIDAQRRLNARWAAAPGPRQTQSGPSDPRDAHLTRSSLRTRRHVRTRRLDEMTVDVFPVGRPGTDAAPLNGAG